MQTKQKKRYSVSLNMGDYIALKRITDTQKPPLSLQNPIFYALNGILGAHQNKQVEFDFERGKRR